MERNVITLEGQEVTFGPFQSGSRPEVLSMDWDSEVVCAVLVGGPCRLLRLIHGIRSGVETGVIRAEHLGAIERAYGRDDLLDALVIPYSHTSAGRLAVAWVVAHDPEGWGEALFQALADEEAVASFWSSVDALAVSLDSVPV